jgi:C4-dicarboxylate-specific signal transduction histidine kinase
MNSVPPSESHVPADASGPAFMGRIVASVAHELNNVIAIVEQNAGLLQDLSAQGPALAPEVLAQVVEQINAQTKRAATILRAVRTFAHSTDSDAIAFDVAAHVDILVQLARRKADVRGVALAAPSTAKQITLHGSPFRFLQVLYSVIESCLESAEDADTLSIAARHQDGRVCVRIDGCRCAAPAQERAAAVESLLRSLKGQIRWPGRETPAHIELEFDA